MTKDTLVSRVKQNLEDVTGTFFDGLFIGGLIQDCYDEVAVVTKCIVKTSSSLSWYNNLVHYRMPAYVPDYYKPLAIFNRNTNRWIEFRDKLVLTRFRFDWELTAGNPWFAAISGIDLISFFPHFSGAGWPYTTVMGSYDLIYAATAPVMLGSDSPIVNVQYMNMFEDYAMAEALESVREFSKAAEFWKSYFIKLDKLKKDVRTQMNPDQMLYLDPSMNKIVGGPNVI